MPDAVMSRFNGIDAFEVSTDGESIVLRPFEGTDADAVRARLETEGITEQDVVDAIAWARSGK